MPTQPESHANGQSETDDAVDETTPLLGAPSSREETLADGSVHQQNGASMAEEDDDKPLDSSQVLLLCFARLSEPISFFCIFPFVNKMIKETGDIPEVDVGFYAGLIESLFSLTQMIMMIPYGRVSDRVGRKPVLIVSLIGLTLTVSLFGFSQSIWQMILFRCLAGLFSGTVVTIRAMISEVSTKKTQARAFSIFAFVGNIGIFLGTLIGGFANPAESYPRLFGWSTFLKKFPYALPPLVAGVFAACGTLVSILFIKETMHQDKDSRKSSTEPQMSTWDVIKSPGVPIVLFIWSMAGLLGFAFTAVIPVFQFTSIELGGYGFEPAQISFFLMIAGISQAIWLIVAFPPLQRRFGTGGVLRGCATAWPILFALNPAANYVLRAGWTRLFWIVTPIVFALGSGCAMAFTGVQLAINDISPSPSTLGTINGIALTLYSGTRAFTPALFNSLFAFGVRNHILDGHFVWVIMIICTLIFGAALRWLPEKAEGKIQTPSSSDEGT